MTSTPQPEPNQPEHRYNLRGLSPKAFLLEVMWDQTVDLPMRMKAAESFKAWHEPGDFREPDLGYRIPAHPDLEVIHGGKDAQGGKSDGRDAQ